MKKFVILIFLLICYLTSSAQVSPTTLSQDGKSVTMDLTTYRDLKEKYYRCDTTMKEKEMLLTIKDSSIFLLKQKINLQSVLLIQKDTTIKQLNKNNSEMIVLMKEENKKSNSILKNTPAWIGITIGVVFGFLLAK